MRVHHLNCGTMRPFGGRLVDGTGSVLRRAEMVCHCLLLETSGGLVWSTPDSARSMWTLRAGRCRCRSGC